MYTPYNKLKMVRNKQLIKQTKKLAIQWDKGQQNLKFIWKNPQKHLT